ncbi:tetratricopeptide repeat-containing sensor histidine kinase [Flavisericum labens]|uniref:tetratricopeptide repeat-containing sensor histidine kinase n=1 Tax=Flavisericum labens TaxID=3377112 RepID=UPI00387B0F68
MKIKSVFALSLFLLITNNLIAQQKVIDSLEQQLLNPSNGLSIAENLNELSWYYAFSNSEKGIDRANKAIENAIKDKDSLQLGIAYERKGFNYQNQGKDSLTIVFYEKAKNIYAQTGHQKFVAGLTFNIGNFYFYRSNYKKSLNHVEEALGFYKKGKDSIRMSRSYNLIGLNQMYLGDYSLAIETFQKGLLFLELTGNSTTQFYAELQGNLALLYEKISDFEKALEYQNKALILHKKNNYKVGISNTYANIGKLYGRLGQHQKALEAHKESLKLKEQLDNKYRLANGLTNLGITYSELKQYPNAIENLNKAKLIYKELEHNTNLSTVYKNLGDIYLDKNQSQKAFVQFDSAYIYAKKAEDKRAMFLAKEGLSKALFLKANYKRAYKEQAESLMIKDSLLSNEKRDEYANLKAKYEYEKEKAVLQANFEKDKAIDAAEIKQQMLIRNISIGAGIFGIVVLGIVLTLVRRNKEAKLKGQLATSELQKIRAQLNPHFIFNSLNSIGDYVQKNGKDKARNYIERFAAIMRKILDNSQKAEIPLEKEIEFLEGYIKLEQQRLENRFDYTVNVDSDIDEENTLVPPALYQPFIENSIWYAFPEKKGKGQLTITFEKEQNTLVCTIDDNGLGIKQKQETDKKSFGISGVQNRVELFKQIKRSEARVEIIEKEQGVRVIIQIPLSLEF